MKGNKEFNVQLLLDKLEDTERGFMSLFYFIETRGYVGSDFQKLLTLLGDVAGCIEYLIINSEAKPRNKYVYKEMLQIHTSKYGFNYSKEFLKNKKITKFGYKIPAVKGKEENNIKEYIEYLRLREKYKYKDDEFNKFIGTLKLEWEVWKVLMRSRYID